jgi:hypothetical protein
VELSNAPNEPHVGASATGSKSIAIVILALIIPAIQSSRAAGRCEMLPRRDRAHPGRTMRKRLAAVRAASEGTLLVSSQPQLVIRQSLHWPT